MDPTETSPRVSQSHHDREYQDADDVVEDRRAQDGDAFRRTQPPQVAHHPHGDSYGGGRHYRAYEQRLHVAEALRVAEHYGQHVSEDEGQYHAANCDEGCRPRVAQELAQVGLQPCEEEQDYGAHLGDGPEGLGNVCDRVEVSIMGKVGRHLEQGAEVREFDASQREGPDDDASRQLAEDSGHFQEPLEYLPCQLGSDEDRRKLQHETHYLFSAMVHTLFARSFAGPPGPRARIPNTQEARRRRALLSAARHASYEEDTLTTRY